MKINLRITNERPVPATSPNWAGHSGKVELETYVLVELDGEMERATAAAALRAIADEVAR